MTELRTCAWATVEPELSYHDSEWGVPSRDERFLFEKLILDGAQAGVSWRIILNKREGYRRLFEDFDAVKMADYTDEHLETLLLDPSIIRNRLKVFGARKNARAWLALKSERDPVEYLWSFVGGKPIVHARKSMSEIPATSPEGDALSKDLKQRGFTFVGPTIMYAFMQAAGLVNDHEVTCPRYEVCCELAKNF
ncbi:MAG: DNA-3-methyladenine glycosylase I [Chthonomonas sp.]|nr:DNA-3-methyladenine glycosylase I [Chthonomonas sp.]